MEPLISVRDLRKVFRQGFFMRKVQAVGRVSFEVPAGSIFGFLGPNGAGKTTTIKILMGLIAPSSGTALLFGRPVRERACRERIGFLPENPYVYPYLTPREFVEMSAALSGLPSRHVAEKSLAALSLLGIRYAADRQVRRLSKGMLQRTGLAAALVADPELLVLDEPMSGLDPVGRKEVKDLILDERRQGRTVFFSTHILNDVETLCDKVTMLHKGEVVVSGDLGILLKGDLRRTDVSLLGAGSEFEAECRRLGHTCRRVGERLVVEVESQEGVSALLGQALQSKLQVAEVQPRHETLEELFLKRAFGEPAGA